MKKIDRRIIIVFTFLFIIGLSYGLMRFLIAQKEDPMKRPPVVAKRFVKTDPVKYSNIESLVFAPGRLSSVSDIDIVAEASGKIIEGAIPLKKGSTFLKGDLLFTIYQDEVKLALKSRKSQYLNSIANFLPDIHIDYPEYEDAWRNFFNSIDIDKKLPEFPKFTDEKLKIFLASRNIISEYYNIQKDELQLQRHSVHAPFNGTYSVVNIENGAYTGTGGKVAKAIRTDVLELEVPLSQIDAKWVKIGNNVQVYSKTRDLEWTGTVIRKSQFVDPNTQSQELFIQLKNDPNKPLLVGEYLYATFTNIPVKNVMEIPRNAVFNSDEVFVVVDKRLEKRTIDIVKINEKSLIFNGLNEGEILVTQPLVNVFEGTEVEIDKDVFNQPEKEKGGKSSENTEKASKKSKK